MCVGKTVFLLCRHFFFQFDFKIDHREHNDNDNNIFYGHITASHYRRSDNPNRFSGMTEWGVFYGSKILTGRPPPIERTLSENNKLEKSRMVSERVCGRSPHIIITPECLC